MLDNGVGTVDASSVSPDHGVRVEPLLVDRIGVLRGPATLLYGSSAVGGVVNVIDNRIPARAPQQPVTARSEVRYGTAANERTGVVVATAGNETLAVQVNGLKTEAEDVSIPGFADPANPLNKGTLTNSAIVTESVSVGGNLFLESRARRARGQQLRQRLRGARRRADRHRFAATPGRLPRRNHPALWPVQRRQSPARFCRLLARRDRHPQRPGQHHL